MCRWVGRKFANTKWADEAISHPRTTLSPHEVIRNGLWKSYNIFISDSFGCFFLHRTFVVLILQQLLKFCEMIYGWRTGNRDSIMSMYKGAEINHIDAKGFYFRTDTGFFHLLLCVKNDVWYLDWKGPSIIRSWRAAMWCWVLFGQRVVGRDEDFFQNGSRWDELAAVTPPIRYFPVNLKLANKEKDYIDYRDYIDNCDYIDKANF
jgi:hypothetical protein